MNTRGYLKGADVGVPWTADLHPTGSLTARAGTGHGPYRGWSVLANAPRIPY